MRHEKPLVQDGQDELITPASLIRTLGSRRGSANYIFHSAAAASNEHL